MKTPIKDRLEASLRIDAINGDSFERAIVAKQIREAIAELAKKDEEMNVIQNEIGKFAVYLKLPGDGRLLSEQVIEAFAALQAKIKELEKKP